MGRGSRGESYKGSATPGPGTYQAKSSIGDSKIHFGGRYDISKTEIKPGPGQYNVDYKLRQGKSGCSISGRYGSSSRGSEAPGPGSYNIGMQRDKLSGRFGKDTRKALNSSGNVAPGPGQYETRNRAAQGSTAPHYSFGTKPLEGRAVNESKVPGPGTYNYKSPIGTEGVKTSISGHRPTSAVTASHNVPGPGAYNVTANRGGAPSYK